MAATTAYDMLMETEHLFSKTHWNSGQFLKLDGYKPTMCAMGAIRLSAIGGLDFFNEVLEEDKAKARAQYGSIEEWWEPSIHPVTAAMDDSFRFWSDPEYVRSLYCLMTAVAEQSSYVDPALGSLADDYGREPYTSLDYYKDTDDILSSAEEAIFAWNDATDRKTEEVVAAFHRAAELANDKSFAPIPVAGTAA